MFSVIFIIIYDFTIFVHNVIFSISERYRKNLLLLLIFASFHADPLESLSLYRRYGLQVRLSLQRSRASPAGAYA